ncbi:MAG: FMN-binding protein [Deltaproteobacteria bacterium]|nr:MAG: FMN-binding protein [Deltaproteobacteria bacterium]
MLSLLLCLLALVGGARAQQFWTPDALLADMFPTADRFEPIEVHVDASQARELRRRTGADISAGTWRFQAAWAGSTLLGTVLFDQQKGQHEPIDFAVQFSPDRVVVRQEVVTYREKYGDGVRDPRFRRQFVGKTADDPLVAGKDIIIVSGATYSSRAMAIGVKRALVLAELLPPLGGVADGEAGE